MEQLKNDNILLTSKGVTVVPLHCNVIFISDFYLEVEVKVLRRLINIFEYPYSTLFTQYNIYIVLVLDVKYK